MYSSVLHKLARSVLTGTVDGRLIASTDITEDLDPISMVLSDLACTSLPNIITNVEHPIVIKLPWFELHSKNIGGRKCKIKGTQFLRNLAIPQFGAPNHRNF